jgi:hypothetical protein
VQIRPPQIRDLNKALNKAQVFSSFILSWCLGSPASPNQLSLHIHLRHLKRFLLESKGVLPFENCSFLCTLPLLVLPFISVYVNQLANKNKTKQNKTKQTLVTEQV